MRMMSFDKLLFLKENILIWHKMRVKMYFCDLKSLCAFFRTLGVKM